VNDATAIKEEFKSIMRETSPEEIHFDYSCANIFDIQDMVDCISIPSLVIAVENDGMIPLQISEHLAESLQNSQLTLIQRAGHLVILEQPEAVNKEIKAFINHLQG
jgi:pimeloyl-ACP methyl ester carboxylesterase